MRRNLIALFLASGFGLSGCYNHVVFTTQTSLGLDVSGTTQMPDKVSLSHNRCENAIIPRKTDGQTHTVYGGLDSDLGFFKGHTIRQTFATGKAAMYATNTEPPAESSANQSKVNDRAPLVFVTGTTFGLHLSAGQPEMSPNLLLGYRRLEVAVIPVPDPDQEVRSVYADILINSSTDQNATAITENFSALRGVRIKQSFATGRAAEALAKTPAVVARLDEAAGIKATRVSLAQLKTRAESAVADIRKELERLNDNRLPQAVAALREAKVLGPNDLADAEQIPPAELRQRIKNALDRQTAREFSDPETVRRLEDALVRLKKIQN